MKYLLTLLLIAAIIHNGECCINEYRTLLNGEVSNTDAGNAAPSGRFNKDNKTALLSELNQTYQVYNTSHNLHDYSDYGAMLIYCGRFEEAKAVFLIIEQRTPNEYANAANIGTTYELLGQIDSAIYWLTKAVKINPDSHKGSEWIHLKVLEAKQLANGDEQKLWHTDILALGLGDDKLPKNNGSKNLAAISDQLYSQLRERMSFIKPKDPIVGRLLFDLGNVVAITYDVKSALQVYEVARTYGYHSEVLDARERHFKWLQLKWDLRNSIEDLLKRHIDIVLILMGVAFIGLMIFGQLWKERRRAKETNTPPSV